MQEHLLLILYQGYIFLPLSKVKNREEFKGGLEKGKEKGWKEEEKEKSDKTHVKIPLWSLNTAKNPQKQGRILEGGDIPLDYNYILQIIITYYY